MKKRGIIAVGILALALFSVYKSEAGLFGKFGKLDTRSDGTQCCRWSLWTNECLRNPFFEC